MYVVELVVARGHPNVRAMHETTIEITKDEYLTPRGDCIIGVGADKGAADLSRELKEILRTEGSRAYLVLEAEGFREVVEGVGDPRLELSDCRSLVFRKSRFVDPRTVMVGANKAAVDLDRRLIERLRRGIELSAFIIVSIEPLSTGELLEIVERIRKSGRDRVPR